MIVGVMKVLTARLGALVVLLGVLSVACGGGTVEGNTEYRDEEQRARFELPEAWNVYTPDRLVDLGVVESSPFLVGVLPGLGEVGYLSGYVMFDAAPSAGSDVLWDSVGEASYPVGAQVVRSLTEEDALRLSLADMADVAYFPPVGWVRHNQSVLEKVSLGAGFDGVEAATLFTDPESGSAGVVVSKSVVSGDGEWLLSIAVGCSEACFEHYADEMRAVVDLWVVNTRW